MAKILLVEDDPELQEAIQSALAGDKHTVDAVSNGSDGLDRILHYGFDLAILDWNLPGMAGVDICKQYRDGGGRMPILMLTGKDAVTDKEMGLDAGADDYLTKPFHPRELNARIRALLRRPVEVAGAVLEAGPLKLDPKNHEVLKDGQPVKLVPKEYALLEFLMRHPNQLFSPDALIDRVWSSESEVTRDLVKVYVNKLRGKIDSEGQESLIRNIHGLGYIFQPPGSQH